MRTETPFGTVFMLILHWKHSSLSCSSCIGQLFGLPQPVVWPAMEDLPRDLLEFEARFSTEAACREYLFRLRWSCGFCCPRCGGRKGCARSSRRRRTRRAQRRRELSVAGRRRGVSRPRARDCVSRYERCDRCRWARARARQMGERGHDPRQRQLQGASVTPRRRTRDERQ